MSVLEVVLSPRRGTKNREVKRLIDPYRSVISNDRFVRHCHVWYRRTIVGGFMRNHVHTCRVSSPPLSHRRDSPTCQRLKAVIYHHSAGADAWIVLLQPNPAYCSFSDRSRLQDRVVAIRLRTNLLVIPIPTTHFGRIQTLGSEEQIYLVVRVPAGLVGQRRVFKTKTCDSSRASA